VVDRFLGLVHYSVVGSHNEDDHVSDLGPSGAHFGKGLVARGIQKDKGPTIGLYVVGPDMLGDASGFGVYDVRFANGI